MSTRLQRTNSQSWQAKMLIRRVLITDKVAKVMVDMLKEGGLEVTEIIPKDVAHLKDLVKGYDALLVRSSTQVTAEVIEASEGLKLIGRAGTGVDNIDVVAATKKGILVMNTPGANTISAAEHTIALLMAVARNVQQAAISFKVQHKWDRSKLTGIELQGKTLGVLGLGRIGREVAVRMKAFGMRIVGYDPVIPPEAVAKFGITALPFEEVLAIADVLTVHTPLVEGTKGLLGKKTFGLCKRGVIVVNCARGGIVDEEELIVAIDSGIVAGAGLDVFVDEPPADIPNNPLVNHPKVTATPHLGASTEEAQDKVARELATQIIDLVKGKGFDGIINAPALSCSANSAAHPWLSCGYRIGSIIGQLIEHRYKDQVAGVLKSLAVETHGPDVKLITDGLLAATAAGVLNEFNSEKVNMVNALTVAQNNQLKLSSTHDENAEIYKNEIVIRYVVGDQTHTYKATVFHDTARIVQIDQYYVEIEPRGIIVFLRNNDRPGVAAFVGRHFADDNVNISSLSIGRSMVGKALTIVCLDNEPSPGVIEKITSHENIEYGVLVHVQEP